MRSPAALSTEKLSQHFWLNEFVRSDQGERAGIDNTPPAEVLAALRHTAKALERIRSALGGHAIDICSGYRCEQLNRLVKGSRNSLHMLGLAADSTCWGFGEPRAVAQAIAGMRLPLDELIYEGTWVHVAVAPEGAKPLGKVLTARFRKGRKAEYLQGIV